MKEDKDREKRLNDLKEWCEDFTFILREKQDKLTKNEIKKLTNIIEKCKKNKYIE